MLPLLFASIYTYRKVMWLVNGPGAHARTRKLSCSRVRTGNVSQPYNLSVYTFTCLLLIVLYVQNLPSLLIPSPESDRRISITSRSISPTAMRYYIYYRYNILPRVRSSAVFSPALPSFHAFHFLLVTATLKSLLHTIAIISIYYYSLNHPPPPPPNHYISSSYQLVCECCTLPM